MIKVELFFYGYSWDYYFYTIANKSGILVAYRGSLDKEGFIKMNDILFIEGADTLNDLYESEKFVEIRNALSPGERLFFSYAEIPKASRDETVATLKKIVGLGMPSSSESELVHLSCKGACALFPKDILI